MILRFLALVVITLSFASAALAGGTITSGNASLQFVGIHGFDTPNGDTNLICDTGGSDSLYKLCWYYRSPVDSVNRIFSYVDSPSESFVGSTATFSYPNAGPGVSGNARFNATLTASLTDGAAANQAIIDQRMVFTASAANATTQTFQVFLIIDPDLGGTPTDDRISVADGALVRIQMTESPGANTADSFGIAATRYEINSGTVLRAKLNSTATGQDLATAAPSVAPALSTGGEYAFAYQWTLTLAPGASRVLWAKYGYNRHVCPTDFNNDGSVAIQDIFDYLNAWFAGAPSTDFNLDGQATIQDIFDFLNQWFAGC